MHTRWDQFSYTHFIYSKMYGCLPFPSFYNNNHCVFQLYFKSTLQIIEMAIKSYLLSNKRF